MKKPIARPTQPVETPQADPRAPRAFTPPKQAHPVESFSEVSDDLSLVTPAPKRRHWLWRIFFAAIGILLSLALYLAAEELIRSLFARYEWLGWAATGIAAALVIAALLLAINEISAVFRLRKLDDLRHRARETIASDKPQDARRLIAELQSLYAARPDMAAARKSLDADTSEQFDGSDMIRTAERALMQSLDTRAKRLTSAAARRVAIVTAISPRALVDVAFVGYESIKLARAVAELYGVRPGLFGSWRLFGAILSHLAVTGGVALGDSVIQQLLGHGLAAKLSARLGEGLVNGLMTARVGIAAMRVTRPLPFEALKQPVVMDFAVDLARLNVSKE